MQTSIITPAQQRETSVALFFSPAEAPEKVYRLQFNVLSAKRPPVAGKFLSPVSRRDALPRRVFHSSPLFLSARDLTTASEIDAQIPGKDKGKISLIHCQMPLEACQWRCLEIFFKA